MRECLDTTSPVPNKRVHYAFGMVMGVEDFRQEQEHFEWKHRLSNLRLHGYGTVCGLHLERRVLDGGAEVEIRIAPGYAISPLGAWVWVERALCAHLGEWLRTHPVGSPFPDPGPHTLYVKLCYRECKTDIVPVAGRPCASDEDTREASRITEAAHAEFSWTPPAQEAEDQYRAFGALLNRVRIVAETLSPDDSQLLLDAVRHLGEGASLGTVSPWIESYQLSETDACDTLREALAIWVTEVCPRFSATREECILLGCVDFDLTAGGTLIPNSVRVRNCERPVLVPSRLQQELFCLAPRGGGLPVRSGLVRFRNVAANSIRNSPTISLDGYVDGVAIMLAAELDAVGNALSMGDLEAVSTTTNVANRMPLLMAFYQPNSTGFTIRLRDRRTAGGSPQDWVVRWWAVPRTEEAGAIDA